MWEWGVTGEQGGCAGEDKIRKYPVALGIVVWPRQGRPATGGTCRGARKGEMSVSVGPGEGVEGQGRQPSIYIYIDICTGTCVYFFLYIGCLYTTRFVHGHIFHSV